jgi:hypothetical protein
MVATDKLAACSVLPMAEPATHPSGNVFSRIITSDVVATRNYAFTKCTTKGKRQQ